MWQRGNGRFPSTHDSNAEGITFILPWCEVEDIICIQTQTKSDKYDDGKSDKPCPVINDCKKGNEKNPKGGIVNFSYQGQGMRAPLFNRNVVV